MWQQSERYKNKYRIPTNRLRGYDYSANGCYYVTICTKNREHYFGEIVQHSDNVICDVETDNYASLPTAVAQPHVETDNYASLPTAVAQPHVETDNYASLPTAAAQPNVETDNYASLPTAAAQPNVETDNYASLQQTQQTKKTILLYNKINFLKV